MSSTVGGTQGAGSSTSTAVEEQRPQAGPLPSKRGEIGYVEDGHDSVTAAASSDNVSMHSRHPADRSREPSPENRSSSGNNSSGDAQPGDSAMPGSGSGDSGSMRKKKRTVYKLGGVYVTTLLRCIVQILFLGGTIVAWVIVARHIGSLNLNGDSSQDNDDSNQNDDNNNSGLTNNTGTIFVYVAFGIAVLGQLLFLERCVYLMRAQRYMFLHPGDVLPRHGRGIPGTSLNMPFTPWNRAPLPTYAAALAQTGHGTGDVDDNLTAIPPPPAYGNTRGSTLLLAGNHRRSLRDRLPGLQEIPSSRPVSYASRMSQEVVADMERSQILEETLARLEDGSGSHDPAHSQ